MGTLLSDGWVLKRKVSPTPRFKAQVLELGAQVCTPALLLSDYLGMGLTSLASSTR